jgi:hypothetical protein
MDFYPHTAELSDRLDLALAESALGRIDRSVGRID